ncbi:hypothetical protein ABB02_00919 [Clostridiaceae bacterium JG1575]|nr:hypothetical protein ABB02_00919 [Clostridiaceae bacterium JG1575]
MPLSSYSFHLILGDELFHVKQWTLNNSLERIESSPKLIHMSLGKLWKTALNEAYQQYPLWIRSSKNEDFAVGIVNIQRKTSENFLLLTQNPGPFSFIHKTLGYLWIILGWLCGWLLLGVKLKKGPETVSRETVSGPWRCLASGWVFLRVLQKLSISFIVFFNQRKLSWVLIGRRPNFFNNQKMVV